MQSLHRSDLGFDVTLWNSKTDRTERGVTFSLPKTGSSICPVTAIDNYLAVRPTKGHSSLFIWSDGSPLTDSYFRRILLRECSKTGVKGNVNCHSLRIGGATALAAQGATTEEIMKLGRWKSDSVRRYLKSTKKGLADLSLLLDK